MQIYLVRHGATAYNTARRYQGQRDIPLSEEGVRALRRADFCPERVAVSPLIRARQTARILFPQAEQVVVDELKEMNFGIFEGKHFTEIEKDPEFVRWVGENGEGQIPGGESKAEFCERSCRAFAALVDEQLERDTEGRLVIVAHGGTQMAVMERFALPRKGYYDWLSVNGGGYVCSLSPEEWRASRTMHFVRTVAFSGERTGL